MKKRMMAALLTACMVLGSWHVVPAFAAETADTAVEESAQMQESEAVETEQVEIPAETESIVETTALPETAAEETAAEETAAETLAEETAAEENTIAPETAETQMEITQVLPVETEITSETETETETEDETADEQDPGYLYDQLRAAAWDDEEAVLLEAGTNVRKVKAVGVDVWNGNGKIDWTKAKAAGVQFAIIRVGFRYLGSSAYEVDARARENMDGAKAAGIPFGVYFFSTAVNVDEGLDEARLVIRTIRNYKLDYPVFFDPEGYDIPGTRNYGVSKSVRTNIALKFMAYIENNGYEAAMYSAKSHLTASAYWDTPKLDSAHDIWVAQYPGGLNTLASGKSAQTTYAGKYRIWQFSSSGRVNGISGDVDLNVEYYDDVYMTGTKAPAVIKQGTAFNISGNVISASPITKVTVAVFNSDGSVKTRAFAYPRSLTYNVSSVASKILFQNMEPGIFRYQIGVSNYEGSRIVCSRYFIVLSKEAILADGIYTAALMDSPQLVLGVKNQLDTVPRNLALTSKDNENNHAKFQIKYDKDGYYNITVLGSGKAVGLNGNLTANVSVAQVASAIRWQILPYIDGGWTFVPEGTDGLVAATGTSSGAGFKLLPASFDAGQRFMLEKASWFESLTIKGESIPVSIKEGWAFEPAGTITSGKALQSVNVCVYASGGEMILNKTVSLTAKSYDLANLKSAINFRTLKPGIYVYRVTAKNASQSKILIKKAFAVLSKDKTIEDGVYNLCYNADTRYTAYVAAKSNVSNGNICLGKIQANNNYEKFRIKYKSNGYYTLQCVGSGKYLSVADKSAPSGTNIIQYGSEYYWQIIPDDSGYALIPGKNWESMMYLKDGRRAVGQNILLTGINSSVVSEWELNKTSVYSEPATLEGAAIPTVLTEGQPFTIQGTISSATNITKVNVGVYNASNKMISYYTIMPGSKTFDLTRIDPYIKFGSLKAGTYYYKVVAINGYGYALLLDQKFTVR